MLFNPLGGGSSLLAGSVLHFPHGKVNPFPSQKKALESMSTTEINPLCGACKCRVKAPANPQPHDKVTCPRCGRSDRFDKVVETVGQHIVHLTHEPMAESIAKSARGNSFIQMTMEKPPHRSFRWVSDYRG